MTRSLQHTATHCNRLEETGTWRQPAGPKEEHIAGDSVTRAISISSVFIRVTRLIHVSAPWLIDVCDMTHSRYIQLHCIHIVTCLIHVCLIHMYMCALFTLCTCVPHSHVRHDINKACHNMNIRNTLFMCASFTCEKVTCATWLIPATLNSSAIKRVPWLIHMCDMTNSHVRHDSFTRTTRLFHICARTHPHVRHDSYTCAIWLTLKSNMMHITRLVPATSSSSARVTWLIHMHDMTHSCVRHVWFSWATSCQHDS